MKKLSVIIWLLAFAVLCAAQDNKNTNKPVPDFSGTWILDKKTSGPESGFGTQIYVDITMIIDHNEPELKFTQKIKTSDGKEKITETIYFTDGRRVGLRGRNDENNFRIVEWNGKKLIRKDTFVIKKGEGLDWFLEKSGKDEVKLNNKEVWELSKDGKTLTQKSSGGTLPGVPAPSAFKMVFRRQT